jgi:hypothetical protein
MLVHVALLLLAGVNSARGPAVAGARRRLHFTESCTGGAACTAVQIDGCVEEDECAADRALCESAGPACVYNGPATTPSPPPIAPPVGDCASLCGNARKASKGNCLLCAARASSCVDADAFCCGGAPPPSIPPQTNPCQAVDCGQHGHCALSHTRHTYCDCDEGYSGDQCETGQGAVDPDADAPCCDECGTYCPSYPPDAPCLPAGAKRDDSSCIAYCASENPKRHTNGALMGSCAIDPATVWHPGAEGGCKCDGDCFLEQKYCSSSQSKP